MIYSAYYESGFEQFKKIRLPRDAQLSNTFTLLDTDQQQVFLFIENQGSQTKLGNLYISDKRGRVFTLSASNIRKGKAVDFERIYSLDGTFLINRYASETAHKAIQETDEVNEHHHEHHFHNK